MVGTVGLTNINHPGVSVTSLDERKIESSVILFTSRDNRQGLDRLKATKREFGERNLLLLSKG